MRSIISETVLGRSYGAFSDWAGRRVRPYFLFPFIGILGFLLVYPVFMVAYGSFRGGPPGDPDLSWTLDGYVRAWSSSETYKALIITFALAVPKVLLGITFATFLTWALTRTNTPGRRIFDQLIWLKVFLPALPMLVAWLILARGRTGLINDFLMHTFNLSKPPLDIGTYWGVIFYAVITGSTMFYLYLGPAFRNMDASLEESARISGASSLTTLRRITVPLLMPAIAGVSLLFFLVNLATFESMLFFLAPKGIYVFSTLIWHEVGKVPSDYPAAMALANAFMIFTAAVILLQFKILGERQYTTVSGRGFAVRLIDLGPWKWASFTVIALWFTLGLFVPMTILILGTFVNTFGLLENGYTLRHWGKVLSNPAILNSIKNTVVLGALVGTLGTMVYGLMSYAYLRTKLRGRKWLEVLSWVPRMSPSIVLAVGIVWAVLGGVIPGAKHLYGSLILMALIVSVEHTPAGMRMMNGGMVQLGPELEESARVSGASWLRTMRKVVLPLLAPTLLNSWLLSFLVGTRALLLLLFIYVPSSKVLSIDIFERLQSNEPQQAAILGVILTAISFVVALAARYVAARQRRAMGGFI
ncbi:MAG: iron ABC transporter permease [Chloroflexi bacterium]|nr:iron ABC transporter permease [Chloroflexota bacterium]